MPSGGNSIVPVRALGEIGRTSHGNELLRRSHQHTRRTARWQYQMVMRPSIGTRSVAEQRTLALPLTRQYRLGRGGQRCLWRHTNAQLTFNPWTQCSYLLATQTLGSQDSSTSEVTMRGPGAAKSALGMRYANSPRRHGHARR